MDKRLKIGLIFMVAAVLLMPLGILLKNENQGLTFTILFLTMLLELVGLIFVVLSVLKRKQKA